MAIDIAFFQDSYLNFALIAGGGVLLAFLLNFILLKQLRRSHDLQYSVINIISAPLNIFIILTSFNFASKTVPEFSVYSTSIDAAYFIFSALLITLVLSRELSLLAQRWLKVNKKYEKTPKLIGKVIIIFVYLIAFLIILAYFDIEITPLIATLGVGGIAIGLALQGTLSNFFAGLHIISDKPINVGDFIEIEGKLTGRVEDIGWRTTTITTIEDTVVVIPNSKLAESVIVNKSLPANETIVWVECGVDYTSDLKNVEKVTLDVARKLQKSEESAVDDYEPVVRFHTFGDSNINFTVFLKVKNFAPRHVVVHKFIENLHQRYKKENIEISWPIRKVFHHGKY